MSFINQGKAGFIIGNVFKRSATTGRNAFMDRRFTKQPGNPPLPPYPKAAWLAAYYNKATFELEQEVFGVGGHFCTHTADIYAPDHEGGYHKFGINEPVWEGYREAGNLFLHSEDFADGSWLLQNGAVKEGVVAGVGPDGEDCMEVSFSSTTSSMRQASADFVGDGIVTTWVRTVTGAFNIRLDVGGSVSPNIPIDENWKAISFAYQGNAGTSARCIYSGGGVASGNVYLLKSQFELADGRTDKITPSEYIKTESAPVIKYFANENGNTVLNNIVTEAVGPWFNPPPWLKYQDAVSQYAQSYLSDDVTYWSNSGGVTVADLGVSEIFPAQNKYRQTTSAVGDFRTLTMPGAGSAGFDSAAWIIEAGSASVVRLQVRDQGTLNVVGDLEINTSDGSIHSTIVDCEYAFNQISPGVFRLALGSAGIVPGNDVRLAIYPSRIQPVADIIIHYAGFFPGLAASKALCVGLIYSADVSGVATDETLYNWAEANHDDAGKEYQTNPKLSGEDQVLLSIGGDPVLEVKGGVVSDDLIITDWKDPANWTRSGNNTIEYDVGEDAIKITYVDNRTGGYFYLNAGGNVADPTEIGASYIFKADVKRNAAGSLIYRARVGGFGPAHNVTEDWVTHEDIIVSSVTTGAHVYCYNLDPGEVAWLRNLSFKKVLLTKQITFSDGTNECSVIVGNPEPHIKANYGTAGMTLDVDGVTASCPYDGSLSENSGGISTECTLSKLLRRGDGGVVQPSSHTLTVGNDGTYWGFKDSTFGSITPGTFEGHTISIFETNPATDDVAIQFDTFPGYLESIIVNETYILPYISGSIYNGVHTALSDLIAAGGTIEITLRGQ